jgi:hypothetical protein
MSQYYPPCIAPTGEPNTCLVCGTKLKNVQMWFINIVRFSDATEEQKADWPHRSQRLWDRDENAYVWRKEPVYQQHFDDPRTGYGLNKWRGDYRAGTASGDGLFCDVRCAVAFARIAGNMGFRLPTVTKKERLAMRRAHSVIQAMCPSQLFADKSYPSIDEVREK